MLSLIAPYVPVLAVLAVTSIEPMRGLHVGTTGWSMVLVLAFLALGRHVLKLLDRAAPNHPRTGPEERLTSDRPPHEAETVYSV